MPRNVKELQNIGLASLGGVLEYFDFQVYVFVAASLSVVLFPPGDSVWKNQVQAFGIFAIGYLVRPIAGIINAHFADRIGRKKLFVFTVLLMSVPTFLMGCLPTYAVAGWMAPAALLVLRILQGCAVGGRVARCGTVFICEHARPRRLGIASGTFLGMVNFRPAARRRRGPDRQERRRARPGARLPGLAPAFHPGRASAAYWPPTCAATSRSRRCSSRPAARRRSPLAFR